MEPSTVDQELSAWASTPEQTAVADTVSALARTALDIGAIIADGPLYGDLGAVVSTNEAGDDQKALDVEANDRFVEGLKHAPVAVLASEEMAEPVLLDPEGALVLVIDPLDGSSNIETNLSIGTIFGIYRYPGADVPPLQAALQPGRALLAAGMFVYGPKTTLIVTLGERTSEYTLDRRREDFVLTIPEMRVPLSRPEYAINASNYRHWDRTVRAYVDDLVAGAQGPRGKDFNMRWLSSLVAETSRVLARGGVFLYPADQRPNYQGGRLRLVYEANPLAMIVECAGGLATDGERPILDRRPTGLHQRVPLVFGSRDKVERVARYYAGLPSTSERSPLFTRRGLFILN